MRAGACGRRTIPTRRGRAPALEQAAIHATTITRNARRTPHAASPFDARAAAIRRGDGRAVLVDRLPLVVVVRDELAVGAGDGLRGLVGLEALVEHPFALGLLRVAEPLVASIRL